MGNRGVALVRHQAAEAGRVVLSAKVRRQQESGEESKKAINMHFKQGRRLALARVIAMKQAVKTEAAAGLGLRGRN